MQKIFEIYQEEHNGKLCNFVKIYVTWKNQTFSLIDLLKIWETPFAKYPNSPGDYHWVTPEWLYGELMVTPSSFPYRTVLACEDLNPGCWPFQVITEETEDQVWWTKFLQPHRDRGSLAGFWDYSRYSPLIFNKEQYYKELQPMKSAYEKWAKWHAEWVTSHPSITATEACKLSKNEILVTLRSRFFEIPKEIETAINNITSLGILDLSLLPRAKTCLSLDEFVERLEYYTELENTESEIINTKKRIGIVRGIAKGKTVANLREKFSEIPEEIVGVICKISDIDTLNLLVTHSQTCLSLDEFVEKLSKISEK
jgi:hypothetical protein